jgi:hypothetical protein
MEDIQNLQPDQQESPPPARSKKRGRGGRTPGSKNVVKAIPTNSVSRPRRTSRERTDETLRQLASNDLLPSPVITREMEQVGPQSPQEVCAVLGVSHLLCEKIPSADSRYHPNHEEKFSPFSISRWPALVRFVAVITEEVISIVVSKSLALALLASVTIALLEVLEKKKKEAAEKAEDDQQIREIEKQCDLTSLVRR